MSDTTKAVKLNESDQAVVAAVQRKLGLRSVSEVLRVGLRALAREQHLDSIYDPKPEQAV